MLTGNKGYFSKVLKRGEWALADLLFQARIKKCRLPKSGSCILLYHGIDDGNTARVNSKFISENELRKQLSWLKQNAQIVSTKEAFEMKVANDGFKVAISFDDGFANNCKYLLPIIEELEIPATIYISTIQLLDENYLWPDAIDMYSRNGPFEIQFNGVKFKKTKNQYVDQDGKNIKSIIIENGYVFAKQLFVSLGLKDDWLESYPEDHWRMMNEEEIKNVSKSDFITIGAHGISHDSFKYLTPEALKNELTGSKKYLEDLTGDCIEEIAFPYGHYNKEVVDQVQEAGFNCQFSVQYLDEFGVLDQRVRDRLGNNPHISWFNQVRAIGNGRY
ncbi:MAG: peptidoglycan/xylan/chitin deacetylase (PgdA/CDA1 family) [Parvicellaceae bacterium]|jgi:peptidoglycan/xylan/chitin deacetylase (PgdA/CDA1 family)